MIDRRELFCSIASVGAGSLLIAQSSAGERPQSSAAEQPQSPQPASGMRIDTNVSLFQWPFRRLPLDQVDILLERLRSLGISQAWAGSFEGLLHRDITGVNERLAQTCSAHRELIPFGTINPTLPDWESDLRRCRDDYRMPGIRLHPNYHGYALTDPRFVQLIQAATSAGLWVQLAVAMEDTRTQHPLIQVADVDLRPLPDVLSTAAGARVQLLNYRPKSSEMAGLEKADRIYFDTARIEGTDGVSALVRQVSPQRVMLGTHAPFLIPEAALIRIHESTLTDADLAPVLFQNARSVLA